MTALLLMNLVGCWLPNAQQGDLDVSNIPYAVDSLSATDAVITGYDLSSDSQGDLLCPDGSVARVFAVYRQGTSEASPVAVVFHSGPFDYVEDPDPDRPLVGTTYYQDSRLGRTWSVSKIWETLGMLYPLTVDPAEQNLGTLGAALADAGVVQLYPGNCWGDLWHNDRDDAINDPNEGFARRGEDMAWIMIRLLVEPNFAAAYNFTLPVQVSASDLYLIGLGEGGRAVSELLNRPDMPGVMGALIDSSPDDLSPYLNAPSVYAEEVAGLERIFYNDPDGIYTGSVLSLDSTQLPNRIGYIWSAQDTRFPYEAVAPGATAMEAMGAWVYNTNTRGHVFLNGDLDLATQSVDWMLGGAEPSLGQ